ncbi:TldD protein [Paramaledivibacter caminithermalis DSM 15212]|jgi:predicted Zn-dependent protease|uniref:TldD protein n=2 Tax=Paramaledivibacter TaxID=1884934 RepID=A0A1M6U5Q0_PARC5|nr:TldD protein [Paramaledivibacter caminithermalis DSM 15212]
MVQDGKVVTLLSDCKTASIQGVASSGNARSVSYKDIPIVRTSNMFIKQGSNSISKLINEVENGYYAKDVLYGHHYNGKFIFRPKQFFELKEGVIRNEVLPPNITGDIMSVLKDIKIGNDLQMNDSGVCHKREQRSLPISISSPSILLKGVAIEN